MLKRCSNRAVENLGSRSFFSTRTTESREECVALGLATPKASRLQEKKRDAHGRWPLGNPHTGEVHFDMEDGAGAGTPSRWNTLRAFRVLDWYAARD
jgi:hypothetical protein